MISSALSTHHSHTSAGCLLRAPGVRLPGSMESRSRMSESVMGAALLRRSFEPEKTFRYPCRILRENWVFRASSRKFIGNRKRTFRLGIRFLAGFGLLIMKPRLTAPRGQCLLCGKSRSALSSAVLLRLVVGRCFPQSKRRSRILVRYLGPIGTRSFNPLVAGSSPARPTNSASSEAYKSKVVWEIGWSVGNPRSFPTSSLDALVGCAPGRRTKQVRDRMTL